MNDSVTGAESIDDNSADGGEGVTNVASYSQENEPFVKPHKENPSDLLIEAGVALLMETLLEYERGSVGIYGSFDFAVADPFQKVGKDPSEDRRSTGICQNSTVLDELIDNKGVTLYVQSVRRILRGGAFFLCSWNGINFSNGNCAALKASSRLYVNRF